MGSSLSDFCFLTGLAGKTGQRKRRFSRVGAFTPVAGALGFAGMRFRGKSVEFALAGKELRGKSVEFALAGKELRARTVGVSLAGIRLRRGFVAMLLAGKRSGRPLSRSALPASTPGGAFVAIALAYMQFSG